MLALIAVSSETDEERTFTFSQLHDECQHCGCYAAVAARAAWRSRIGLYADDCRSADNPAGLRAYWRDPSVSFGGFASHSVARIDDAALALIVSADAGARGGKILPYKSCSMTLLRRRVNQPSRSAGGQRAGEKMAWVDGRDLALPRCASSISARACRWRFKSNETSRILIKHLRHYRQKPKGASSATSAVMWWRWQLHVTPFLAVARRRTFAHRILAGSSATLYRLRAVAGRHGDYCLRRIADVPGLRVCGKLSRNTRANQMFPPVTAIFAC